MLKMYVERKKSQKGTDYFCLGIDFGYRKQSITFETAIICAFLNITEQTLYTTYKENDCKYVGTYEALKEVK